jgi:indole-3-glycerol phosphate synthase
VDRCREERRVSRLDPILRDVRVRLAERRSQLPLAQLRGMVKRDESRGRRFMGALRTGSLAIIAECKRASPSAGPLSGEIDWRLRATQYARGGAAALSVLTEYDHFHGAPEHLGEVRASGLPLLRKDFVLDESMVLESALWGADAVLLLPVALGGALLAELFAVAQQVGLAALVEVHDDAELERALALEPDLIGVNARDLTTFDVDLATVEHLLPRIPNWITRVAESGLRDERDLKRVRAAGADAALVGEALMRSTDPRALLAHWKAVVRG